MRIYLQISKPNQLVPFNHQPKIVGSIHKWIGKNEEHGEVSLYSFSQLMNGKLKNGRLDFSSGSTMFISSIDNNFIHRIIDGIRKSPQIAFGMEVKEIIIQKEPDFTNTLDFMLASPILVKRKSQKGSTHFHYKDPESETIMTKTLQTKMKLAGMSDPSLRISFISDYPKAKTKIIEYRGIKNRVNWCPIHIEGTPEARVFAWNVGIGNSTGIGFGALK